MSNQRGKRVVVKGRIVDQNVVVFIVISAVTQNVVKDGGGNLSFAGVVSADTVVDDGLEG